MNSKNSQPTKGWRRLFATDCERCRRLRLVIAWAIIAIPVALWWLHMSAKSYPG